MIVTEDWPGQRTRHKGEQYHLVRGALIKCGWRQGKTAELLGCSLGTLDRVIKRYRDLWDQVQAHNPGPGRPRAA